MVGGVEFERLGKLRLGSCEVVAVKQARPGEIGIFGLAALACTNGGRSVDRTVRC
jgi:hypothetical protein